MAMGFLKLNMNKSEAILVASLSTLKKLNSLTLVIQVFITSSVAQVRNLGVILDSLLYFFIHINTINEVAFFHLKNIGKLHTFLLNSVAATHKHAFITSHTLD